MSSILPHTNDLTPRFLLWHVVIFVYFLEVPSITQHPQDSTGLEGDEVTLCCKAEGTPSPNYQWYMCRNLIQLSLREKETNIV